MHKFRYRIRDLFLLLTLGASAIWAWGRWWPIDGVRGIVARTLSSGDTTVYAPGYSDEKFNSITIGMSQSEVYKLLGPPLRCWNGPLKGEQLAAWTYSPNDADYWIREIALQDEIVVEKNARYWLD